MFILSCPSQHGCPRWPLRHSANKQQTLTGFCPRPEEQPEPFVYRAAGGARWAACTGVLGGAPASAAGPPGASPHSPEPGPTCLPAPRRGEQAPRTPAPWAGLGSGSRALRSSSSEGSVLLQRHPARVQSWADSLELRPFFWKVLVDVLNLLMRFQTCGLGRRSC